VYLLEQVMLGGRRVTGLGLGDPPPVGTNNILESVLARYNVADAIQLPPEVLARYRDAQVYLRDQATQIAGGDAALGGALASTALNIAGSIIAGNPKAAFMAAWNGMLTVMVVAGGPYGAAVAVGLEAIMAIVQALPHAQAGAGRIGDACNNTCGSQNWYGGFTTDQNPPCNPMFHPSSGCDPNASWIPWDNKVPKKIAIENEVACSDDVPTSEVYSSCRDFLGDNQVSGKFTWLRTVLAFYPEGGFDHTLAFQIKNALELYLNMQWPVVGGSNGLNLRDVATKLVDGWNATHEPGNVITIDWHDHLETLEGFHNETYQKVTDTALKNNNPWTGALAGFLIGMDSRNKVTPTLHTGPVVQPLRNLFAPPSREQTFLPPVDLGGGGVSLVHTGNIIRISQTTPSTPTSPSGMSTGAKVAVGALVVGGIGTGIYLATR